MAEPKSSTASSSNATNHEDSQLHDRDCDTSSSEEKAPATAVTSVATLSTLQDGGTRAWLQVLGSFIVFGNLWGFTFAFGSFQSYYELDYLPGETASSISWIGTVSVFLLICIGIISGPLFDLGYFKSMLLAGAAIETLGVFLTSICSSYWQLMLTQGILMGLGNGLLYLPGLALVGRSFKRHRAIAMGITTCGAPVGGVYYTLIFEQLISKMGFGWTVRIMGFVMLGSYCISFPLLLWGARNIGDLASGAPRKLFDRGALTNTPFWTYSTSNFLIFCGYMVPFNFIPSYAQLVLGLDRSMSLYIAMIAQASSVVGRLVAGYSASKIGVLIPWIVCASSSGIICVAWIGAHTTGGFIAIAALYGCFSGALIPLPPSVFPVVCPDPKVFGARLGMAQGIASIASLIGPPIAAALASLSSTPGETNYLGLQLFGGLVMLAGACNLGALWIVLAKRREQGSSKLI
ncbi:related to monocarboxylate transporter [Lecanosticta acicola]|uniref:Related to monocarboxylate transporter n=1 Tax=Lecanosticta acicola TaxID=111012 RepID=A0AAI8W1G0_9PEZI|nr:related to monocarboxylate transporter [Lecanosticta acicola]